MLDGMSPLKTLLVAIAVAAACVATSSAGAGKATANGALQYGISDDWPKYHVCGDVWWTSAQDIGYVDLRVTVQWDGTNTIDAGLLNAVSCASAKGVRLVVAVYPAKPNLIGSSDAAQTAFANFVALVATTAGPTVTNFIVGNEPNVNRFWQPQYANGKDAAGADYEHTLAKAYDALKVVRPDALVWGPAISSRGNDHTDATSNPSHSPVWFIKDMGDAYRASGRTKPIFDIFDIHPYPPIQDTDPFSKPFQWPQAGAANLDRIKQALWDAFHGTGQPTPAEQSGGRTTQAVNAARFNQPQTLPISLDEVGEQTVITGHEGAYTDGPDSITPISEQQQAANHVALMEIAACDPDVQSLFFFPLIDEGDVHNGFQSGNLFADLQPKQSYAAVKAKIAAAQGSCLGGVTSVPETWQHTTTVIGAKAFFGGTGLVNAPNRGAQQRAWGFTATAGEDTNYIATLTRVSGPSGGSPTTVDTTTGLIRAYFTPAIKFKTTSHPPGYYQLSMTMSAAVNPGRTAHFVSNVFVLGTSGTSTVAGAKVKAGSHGHHRPKPKPKRRKHPH
jgi:hypothetical protein